MSTLANLQPKKKSFIPGQGITQHMGGPAGPTNPGMQGIQSMDSNGKPIHPNANYVPTGSVPVQATPLPAAYNNGNLTPMPAALPAAYNNGNTAPVYDINQRPRTAQSSGGIQQQQNIPFERLKQVLQRAGQRQQQGA